MVVPSLAPEWNPYSPPKSPIVDRDEFFAVGYTVPASTFGKFALAFHLLGSNIVLFSLILLTVWLPANLLMESLAFNAPADDNGFGAFRLNNIIRAVFGIISIGALIYALARRMQGEEVTYSEAMSVGFRRWGSLFAANFFAGMIVLLGFLALIVPGIILQVRYSLLDSVVVLERHPAPRPRSTSLTEGRRWPIFWAYVLFFLAYIPVATGINIAISQLDVLNNYWVSVALDCVSDVLESISTIVMFLFYWEARLHERGSSTDRKDDGPPPSDERSPSKLARRLMV